MDQLDNFVIKVDEMCRVRPDKDILAATQALHQVMKQHGTTKEAIQVLEELEDN